MKKTACFVFILFIFLIPSAAFGEYFIGVEYNYYKLDIEKIDAINTPPNSIMNISDLPPGTPYIDLFPPPSLLAGLATEVQLLDIYSDHYSGASLLIGYKFNLPMSIEVGYFKSESNKGSLNGERGDILSAESDLSFESYRFEILTHFSRPYLGKVILTGSVGVVMQKLDASTSYLQQVICPAFPVGLPCPPFLNGEKTEINRKRLQLGAGVSYEFTKNLSLRGMFRFIPAGFSYTDNKPYLLNIGLIYTF